MLLSIYLGMVVACGSSIVALAYDFDKKMERKGYEKRPLDCSIGISFKNLLTLLLMIGIPILNILLAISLNNQKKELYEKLEKQMLDKGELYVPIQGVIQQLEKGITYLNQVQPSLLENQNIVSISDYKDKKDLEIGNYSKITRELDYLKQVKSILESVNANPTMQNIDTSLQDLDNLMNQGIVSDKTFGSKKR